MPPEPRPDLVQLFLSLPQCRPVPGFRHIYVLDNGRVVSVRSGSGAEKGLGRLHLFVPTPHYRTGHARIRLSREGTLHRPYLHRLVCEAFHGPSPDPKAEVLHLDDDPDNNRADNLKWGTRSENALLRETARRRRREALQVAEDHDPWG